MKKILSKLAIVTLMGLSLTGCYNTNDANKALQAQGFTNIQVTGHRFFACAKDDFYATAFTATNPKGQRVSGTVCSGFLFKNSTVRW